MTLNEATAKLAQDLAKVINDSKVPMPIVKNVLSDLYNAIIREENAQLEAQYAKNCEEKQDV